MARGQRRVIWTEEALRALDEVLEYIHQFARSLYSDTACFTKFAPTEVRILSLLHGARDFAKWRRGE